MLERHPQLRVTVGSVKSMHWIKRAAKVARKWLLVVDASQSVANFELKAQKNSKRGKYKKEKKTKYTIEYRCMPTIDVFYYALPLSPLPFFLYLLFLYKFVFKFWNYERRQTEGSRRFTWGHTKNV